MLNGQKNIHFNIVGKKKDTSILPFCWRTVFACSGSMCTNLVTNECPSPWLKTYKQHMAWIWGQFDLFVLFFWRNFFNEWFPMCIVDLLHLEKMGQIQYLAWSPNTSTTFRRKPREKPFLSGPFGKTGALKASAKKKQQQKENNASRCLLVENAKKWNKS